MTDDFVFVVGDVGVEMIHRDRMLWAGAGGSALNLADTLCTEFNIRTLLATRADRVLGWQVKDILHRFRDLNEALAGTRLYSDPNPGTLSPLGRAHSGFDLSAHFAILTSDSLESVYSGRDIDLAGQPDSFRNAMDGCVVAAVDTRLTEETLQMIAEVCREFSIPLIVVRNGREPTLRKFAGVGRGGGCQLLVLNSKDSALFGQRDPCEVAAARLVAYVNPEQRSWSIHVPGLREALRGEVTLGRDEVVMDTIGALEGFTAGYIASVLFDNYILESRQAADTMNSSFKRALKLVGGNTLSLRDADDPELNVSVL